MTLHQRSLTAEIRSIDPAAHRVTALVSSGAVDRYNTIFLPSAWEHSLPAYLATNPILLWGHRHEGDPSDAIGHAVDGRVTADGLEVTFAYAVDANPTARQVWDLIVAGVIRAFSIGAYIRAEVTRTSPKDQIAALPDYARAALLAGEAVAVYTDAELAEVSQVLIGANREALLASVRRGLITPTLAARLEDESGGTVMPQEIREGKSISAANRAKIETACSHMETAIEQCRGVIADGEPDAETDAPIHMTRATEARFLTPLVADCCARLHMCANMIADCSMCRCAPCNDMWGECACACAIECCCCAAGHGDCGTCPCCVEDARCMAECCAILEEVLAQCRDLAAAPNEGAMEEHANLPVAEITDEEAFARALAALAEENPEGALALMETDAA